MVVAATSYGKPWLQPCRTGDVEGLFTCLGDASPEDLLDRRRIDTCAFDQFDLHRSEQLGGVNSGQCSVALADCGAHCLDDHSLGHVRSFGVAFTEPR